MKYQVEVNSQKQENYAVTVEAPSEKEAIKQVYRLTGETQFLKVEAIQ